jgi:DNA-binding transcriptional MocR family regulator
MTIWNPNLKKYSGPKYKALADAISDDIKSGVLKPEQKLPTHRDLAESLGVTVGTVTRGYAEAEKRELLNPRMGSGTYVSGIKNGMGDYLGSLKEDDGLIDMSLSITLTDGQEHELANLLRLISRDTSTLKSIINYQSEAGTPAQRLTIGNWLQTFGISSESDRLIICNGGQNALNAILMALTHPDDRILSENLTYPGFSYLAKQHHLKQIGVPMDDDGLIPAKLETLCQKHQPKLLYCIPNLQNPTAVTIPEKRRYEIVEIARRYDLVIVEDQVQGVFHSDPPIPLVSIDPERVVYCGSFSKVFAGGLRAGHILAPEKLKSSIISALYLDCLFAPPLMAEIACQAIRNGDMKKMIRSKVKEITSRQKLVRKYLGGFKSIGRSECPHVWLELPEPWDADLFTLQLQKKGVLVKPTTSFAVGRSRVSQGVRICLTSPGSRDLVEKGLRIIRQTLEQQPDVLNSVM